MKFDFVNIIKNDSSIWYFQGHAKTVGILVAFGATVDALDNNGWTPLLCGAYYMGNFREFKI